MTIFCPPPQNRRGDRPVAPARYRYRPDPDNNGRGARPCAPTSGNRANAGAQRAVPLPGDGCQASDLHAPKRRGGSRTAPTRYRYRPDPDNKGRGARPCAPTSGNRANAGARCTVPLPIVTRLYFPELSLYSPCVAFARVSAARRRRGTPRPGSGSSPRAGLLIHSLAHLLHCLR